MKLSSREFGTSVSCDLVHFAVAAPGEEVFTEAWASVSAPSTEKWSLDNSCFTLGWTRTAARNFGGDVAAQQPVAVLGERRVVPRRIIDRDAAVGTKGCPPAARSAAVPIGSPITRSGEIDGVATPNSTTRYERRAAAKAKCADRSTAPRGGRSQADGRQKQIVSLQPEVVFPVCALIAVVER